MHTLPCRTAEKLTELTVLGSGCGFGLTTMNNVIKKYECCRWSPAFCLCIDNCTYVMDDDMLPCCLYVYKERTKLFHILKNKITGSNFSCLCCYFVSGCFTISHSLPLTILLSDSNVGMKVVPCQYF